MTTFLRNLLTLRFSLRAMLVVVTIGCVVIGWRANRLWRNQRAINSLVAQGIAVAREVPNEQYALSFFGNADVEHIALSTNRTRAGHGEVRAPIWGDLETLTPLRRLKFSRLILADDSDSNRIVALRSVSDAKFISCFFKKNAILTTLERLPRLKSLEFNWCEFEALSDLQAIINIKSLEELTISLSRDLNPSVVPISSNAKASNRSPLISTTFRIQNWNALMTSWKPHCRIARS